MCQAFVEARERGLTTEIDVSNFDPSLIDEAPTPWVGRPR
jgi:hypothetical protein